MCRYFVALCILESCGIKRFITLFMTLCCLYFTDFFKENLSKITFSATICRLSQILVEADYAQQKKKTLNIFQNQALGVYA